MILTPLGGAGSDRRKAHCPSTRATICVSPSVSRGGSFVSPPCGSEMNAARSRRIVGRATVPFQAELDRNVEVLAQNRQGGRLTVSLVRHGDATISSNLS